MKKGIRDNLYVIKKLVKKYFIMADGEWVMNPDKLLPLFTIKKSGHPHMGLTVCISHRSLKHFVERRKTELLKNYSENKSLDNINFIINHLPESIISFDSYTFQPYVKHFYTKKSPLVTGGTRILLEKVENRLEIISIHFRR